MGLMLATLILGGAAASAQKEAPADLDAVWTTSCQKAIEDTIRSARSQVDRVHYDTQSIVESRLSNDETSVWGNGRASESGKSETFVFRCVYNLRSGKLTTVDYSFQRPVGESDAPRSAADHGAPWTAACKQAIHEKIRAEHPKAESIQLDSGEMKQWEESADKTGVSGSGAIVGAAGKERRFIFRCNYDNNAHKLTSSNWQYPD